MTVLLTLHDPLVVQAHPDPGQAPGSYDGLVAGLHTRPALVRHGGRQSGVQLSVHPLAARSLLGVPAGELAGRDEPADAVLGPWAGRAQERMRAARTWPGRLAALAAELQAARRPGGPVAPELRRAWVLLVRDGAPVASVADEVGWSTRRLHARVRAATGLSPQDLRRVARFDRARRAVGAGRLPAEVAVAAGYADQAHLSREFTGFAGLPPGRWLAAERRSVQDGDPAGAPPSHP
ncbi:helix-turn-helix domain-containing protein [Klenkia brasiliensis]|uniref:helix-turn-helix domain-containing protein n=1 Tax=Klenkia brasiliensis TaxID=333142 RepID=UPI000AC37737|nr:helix-turn-helix domain-containing protein [Klenkia brasiliensis]